MRDRYGRVAEGVLWVLEEGGATFIFHDEMDARRALESERQLGVHLEELRSVRAPMADYASYQRACELDVNTAHQHPVFRAAMDGTYPTITTEELCAKLCYETGDTDACESKGQS